MARMWMDCEVGIKPSVAEKNRLSRLEAIQFARFVNRSCIVVSVSCLSVVVLDLCCDSRTDRIINE
jgi:hypothetical protein